MGPQEEARFLEELKRSNTRLSAQQNVELRGIGERLGVTDIERFLHPPDVEHQPRAHRHAC